MSIETEADGVGLRAVGRVVRLTLDALAAAVGPGVTTAQLDRVAAGVLARHGARSAPAMVYGFPGTVLISVNDEVVHGVPGPRRIAPGDIVKLDVTLEKGGYMGDAARTVLVEPASGLARRLRACAESAFARAVVVARAGVRVNEIGRIVEREVRRCGFAVARGLTGHGIGRTIHEPPSVANEYNPRQGEILTEGLVITIEPMVVAGSGRVMTSRDGWTVRTRDGGLASHHEHTLVITRTDPVLLTA
ncbi:MAG TPA: type I methionyl aminopeptidase [Vicinamibacterales bacterium]